MNHTRILGQEWRDENQNTGYPFSSRASRRNRKGIFIPEGTFIDAVFYPLQQGKFPIYLSKVFVTAEKITLTITDQENNFFATAEFTPTQISGPVCFKDANRLAAGAVILDPTAGGVFTGWGAGEHTFLPEETEFAATCHVPIPDTGVSSIHIGSSRLTSKVILVGGIGVALSAKSILVDNDFGGVTRGTEIRVDIVGDPLFRRRLCDRQSAPFIPPRFIRTIRVIGPNQTIDIPVGKDGNFFIYAGNAETERPALRISSEEKNVVVSLLGE